MNGIYGVATYIYTDDLNGLYDVSTKGAQAIFDIEKMVWEKKLKRREVFAVYLYLCYIQYLGCVGVNSLGSYICVYVEARKKKSHEWKVFIYISIVSFAPGATVNMLVYFFFFFGCRNVTIY